MRSTREILITNDDGIEAEGIHVLAGIMAKYGNVTVVAPLHPQSGKSAALSMDTPLYLKQVKDEPGYREYTFNGTPVDHSRLGHQSRSQLLCGLPVFRYPRSLHRRDRL